MHLDIYVANLPLSFRRCIKWTKDKRNFMTKFFMSDSLCREGIRIPVFGQGGAI